MKQQSAHLFLAKERNFLSVVYFKLSVEFESSPPYAHNLFHSWDFSRSHSAPKTSAINHISGPWEQSSGMEFQYREALPRLRVARGSHLALISSGVQICWEGDGFLIGGHSFHQKTKSQGQQDSSCSVHFMSRKRWLPIPKAEWVLFTSYFTESQFSENVLTVSKWHFYVA